MLTRWRCESQWGVEFFSHQFETLTMLEIRILFNRPQLSVIMPPSNPPRVHPANDIDRNNADLNLY